MASIKTNVLRLLDKQQIPYDTVSYVVDESDLSGIHVAAQLNKPTEQVFKTLVTHCDRKKYFVFCIPVAEELDLKKAAKLVHEKKLEMLPVKDLQAVTGYIRGGCSPIGMKKQFPTYIDETAILFDKIFVSAGIRGLQVILSPNDLATYISASFQDLVK